MRIIYLPSGSPIVYLSLSMQMLSHVPLLLLYIIFSLPEGVSMLLVFFTDCLFIDMHRIIFSCHSSEESEVSEPLLVMLQGSGGDADGRREVRGLDGVVAADVRRGEAAARHLPLAPQHTGKQSIRHPEPER
jgi:hypothetical protein